MNQDEDRECWDQNADPSREKDNKGISRRTFMTVGASAGVLGAALGALAFTAKPEEAEGVPLDLDQILPAQEREDFPVLITDQCKRMDHKNTVFVRQMWDDSLLEGLTDRSPDEGEGTEDIPPGWTQLDQALDGAAWSIDGAMSGGSAFGMPQSQAYRWEGRVSRDRYAFESPEDAAKKIKKAARFLGADLVGITKHDSLWDYSRLIKPRPDEGPGERDGQEEGERRRPTFDERFESIEPDFPFKPQSVIVLAFEMDYEAMAASPSALEGAATGLGYSRMSATGYSVANFIRSLGYKAFACGNDVSLSAPYAFAAGLGELGRTGLLVTREYGPRVRLAKVYTELKLKHDKPKTFGVWEFCKSCKRCADECPSGAISDGEPTLEGKTISNNPGTLKWYINPELCYQFWSENRSDCANCISACPFNKPAMWHHQLVAAATSLPGAPLHTVMARMDKLFGFGTGGEKVNMDFWEKAD